MREIGLVEQDLHGRPIGMRLRRERQALPELMQRDARGESRPIVGREPVPGLVRGLDGDVPSTGLSTLSKRECQTEAGLSRGRVKESADGFERGTIGPEADG